ncbi:MAG: Acyl carrier protein [Bacteroidota bacterium]|nr:Acyl carrier protein [Bacteroidota bacterium]
MNNLIKIQQILTKIAKVKGDDLTVESKLADIKGWDSLSQIKLIIALEAEFKVKLATTEIMKLHTVRDIINSIEKNNKC